MCPGSSVKNKEIIDKNYNVQSLVYQKSVPSLWDEGLMVEDCKAQDQLGNDDKDSRADRQPAEYVDAANCVTLICRQHDDLSRYRITYQST